jgi:hypothetical protein
MKKMLIGFIAAMVLVLTCSFSYRVCTSYVDVKCCWVENHKYVVASTCVTSMERPGGVAIVHAESCPCKRH